MKKKIIYISGEGHSGSTLLDIVLGSQKNSFSAGELRFLPDKGIKKRQYCACGVPVPECDIWSDVIKEWDEVRKLDLDSYIKIQNNLMSNRNFFKASRMLKDKPKPIQDLLKDTESLYGIIFSVTKSDCIIDSSKAPGMIPILKELSFDVTVIHLIRRFGHVLNSNKRQTKKDLKAGIEHDVKPINTITVMRSWLLKNMLTKKYSKGLDYRQIKYEEYVNDLEDAISRITDYNSEFNSLLKNRGPFYPRHLVAGNALRMKDEVFVAKKPMNTTYERLNFSDRLLAKCFDIFYKFN
ncbi:sulfotransferase [soil metagenome]